MDSQQNEKSKTVQPPRKPGKPTWPWILLGFACICLCLITPFVAIMMDPTWLNLLKTGAPQVNIRIGTYNGTTYTSPDGNFFCDFKDIMQDGLNPGLYAPENIEQGKGTVYAFNDIGQQYGVDYFNMSLWGGDDLSESLSNPETRQQSLQLILKNILLPSKIPQAAVTHQEFLQSDILFVVINHSGASMLVEENNGVTKRLDYQEGYYIFAAKEWFYFVYYYITPINESQLLSPAVMQSQVDGFYRGCQFQP